MATIYIDNEPYEVRAGQNLLDACLSLGFDIPYFCWHPALHSIGACRQCAVKQFRDEKDSKGKIVMSCMTPAADGTRISIDDPEAKAFRAGVIEWLMTNHPHDCPVCDEGGECHLQDMTVMTGHAHRRYRFKKRTYRNQNLGPFLNHEMNRCIQCYRCLRFYADYAGGRDLNVFASRNHIYFGRCEDGPLENEFSGNLIEVCPTGVFTDKTLKKNYTRKWDLQTAPSICVHCGLGCNTILAERYGKLKRVLSRYNGRVNGYFLCDRGRFGYGFVNGAKRITRPLQRSNTAGGSALEPVSRKTALEHLSSILYFGAKVIGIGSPRASIEANFALKTLVGPDRFFSFTERDQRLVSEMIGILKKGPARTPSMKEMESSDAVFILGEDLTNTAPMMALTLRQSIMRKPAEGAEELGIPLWNDAAVRNVIQHNKGPLYIAASAATKLDDAAAGIFRGAPDDIAQLGFAVAREIDPGAPGVADMAEADLAFARKIARALKEAKRPLVVSGMSSRSESLIKAAGNVALALCRSGHEAWLSFTADECNTFGLGLMSRLSFEEAARLAESGEVETAIILENDLYRRTDAPAVERFLKNCRHVIVLDYLLTRTAAMSEFVLPAGTAAECEGTFINNEGRAQRFFKVFPPEGDIFESWRWLMDAMSASSHPVEWRSMDDLYMKMAEEIHVLKPVMDVSPASTFRIEGMKIPRQSARFSGRTAVSANLDVHEDAPRDDPDSPLSFSMEGFGGMPPASLVARFWFPGWNSVQAMNKFQIEVGGPLRGGDPGKRLIEPDRIKEISYSDEAPEAFRRREDEWLVVPFYHIFGSEELSVMSEGISDMSPAPYLALNASDAKRLGAVNGTEVEIEISNTTYRLPVKIDASLREGMAGLPAGLPGLIGIDLPAWIKKGRVSG